MKKIILLIIPILFFTDCNETGVNEKNSRLITYCDKEYGVEYIRDLGYQSGGKMGLLYIVNKRGGNNEK